MAEKNPKPESILKIGLAQISPVWLYREKTLAKVQKYIQNAVKEKSHLVVFGEALVPGYPFWVERTDGARFNSPIQKEIHAHYLDQAVQIEAGHLDSICAAAKKGNIKIIDALDHITDKPTGLLLNLDNCLDFRALKDKPARHNQTDIA